MTEEQLAAMRKMSRDLDLLGAQALGVLRAMDDHNCIPAPLVTDVKDLLGKYAGIKADLGALKAIMAAHDAG